ncbi:TonB-dependent receptor [Croceibacterium ferulae]|uniref:TonB-dependent receptor n=1 Tax=Croceibacterium ferulae TaxID=1854641 RepID=UPI000EB3C056|nr:TonB-dependent receptor [Croceibacterium ferulae]
MHFIRPLLASSGLALALLAVPATAGEVAGMVVDGSDTIALRSANVRIAELGRDAVTGADGSFLFAGLPAGTYTVVASYVGAPAQELTVTVPATGTVRADFALGGESGAILVYGYGANQASALSRKRENDQVSDVLTRDAIGQFPDQNVAESIRRLPGVNVLNDQGEGRFVSVRGLDPNLNATTLNGVRLPSPEGDIRSVALDVISSDVIQSVEITKSLTPDMDADTIGASIDIETTSAFNRVRDALNVSLEGSYNDYVGEVTPKAAVDFATRVTPDFGISGGLSYYERRFESDNVEAEDWVEGDDGAIYAEGLEYRDYDVERERISASLNLDLRASDTTMLYARGLYSQFEDQEYRRRTIYGTGNALVTANGASGVTFADSDAANPGDEYEITVERDLKDRFEQQRIRTLVVGGETDTDTWHVEYSASWARSTEYENGSIDPITFARDFAGEGLTVNADYSDRRVPIYSASGVSDFLDASTYELDEAQITTLSDAEDTEWAGRLDVARSFQTGSGSFTVQAGGKMRWRDKRYDNNTDHIEGADLTLADLQGRQTYRLIDMGPVVDKLSTRPLLNSVADQFQVEPVDTAFDSAASDYSIREDIAAGYLLGRWDSDTLRVIGGVRYERTDNTIRGNTVTLVESDNGDLVSVEPVLVQREYDQWLPSLNVRLEATDDLILRAAGYRSLVRPSLGQLAPRFLIEESDRGEREGEFGNPDLRPYRAWNFDASAEWYMSSNGALTVAAFYKDVRDYIVDTTVQDTDYFGLAVDEATVPINGDSATIYGVEVGFSQQWTMLPGALDGLITQFNYTWTDATGDVPVDGDPADLRQITLPASSRHTFNASLGYDKGPISFRLAGTYRDRYLDELGATAEEDRYVDDHFQMDLTVRYRATDRIQLFYDWINMNNAKYYAYNTFAGRQNLLQYEEYNWTMKVGARVSF